MIHLVSKVEVAVLDATNSILAMDWATLTEDGIQWKFVLPTDLPDGGKLEVRAYDLPGNMSRSFFDIRS